MPEALAVRASYQHCRRVARRAARNFYYGFLLLPGEKCDALCALYAFMRRADDLSDEPGDMAKKRAALASWHQALDLALTGDPSGDPCLPALADAVTRFGIHSGMLRVLVNGTEMDLNWSTPLRYTTFDELEDYCYHVAGAVGVCCTHVFGFQDVRATDLAKKLGIAFQLTNILRDVAEDLRMGRVYLPQQDLARFGVTLEDLRKGAASAQLRELLRFEAQRARDHYREGGQLLGLVSPDSRAALWALIQIYRGILNVIEARGYDVFTPPRAAVSTGKKLLTLARARLGLWRPEAYA